MTEKATLPTDIWLLIAQHHLIDSSPSVGALSLTNRQFRALLRPLSFRVVSIRLEVVSTQTAHDNASTSPSFRFAQLIQSEPDITDYIQVLWVGHEEDVELRAINDKLDGDSERRSLCYILSRWYRNLKHLAFSFRFTIIHPYTRRIIPTLPDDVLHSILSALSLRSISKLSILMGSLPLEVYSRLQETHIDALTIGLRMINQEGFRLQGQTDWRSLTLKMLRMLKIDSFGASPIDPLLFELLYAVATSNSTRLTTLALKSSTSQAAFYLPKKSYPTVTTLNIYFSVWSVGFPRIVDLKTFSALRTLTLGFNLDIKDSRSDVPSGHQRLDKIIDVLRTIKPEQPLECIDLFIDDLEHPNECINGINQLPWNDLQDLFSPESLQLHWPTLQQINIGFAPRDKLAFGRSDWALLKNTLKGKLACLLNSGFLRLHVPFFSKSVFHDDFGPTT